MLGRGAPDPVNLDNMGFGDGGGGGCCFPGCLISLILMPVIMLGGFIKKGVKAVKKK